MSTAPARYITSIFPPITGNVQYYAIGQLVRASVTITDPSGAAVDPTSLSFSYKGPNDVTATVTYPTGIVKSTTGNYYYDISITYGGGYNLRWVGTGDAQGSAQDTFAVAPVNT